MRKLVYLWLAFLPLAWGGVKVTNVEVKPGWPWNGKVDITYSIMCDEVEGDGTPKDVYVEFKGHDDDRNRDLRLRSLTGDGAFEPVKAGGPYTVTWDAARDEPGINSSAFEIGIYAVVGYGLYMVVDLASWQVRYTSREPDFSSDTCRTTELWLRRIHPGTFTMGSPSDELGRTSSETQHEVTLTQMYYIGIFECTQRQWELIKGGRPSFFNNSDYYATRPVECVSYDMIRGTDATAGAGWPAAGHTVDASSFMGILQARTGLVFDLPTEAEWEYACRAGTTTALNSGKNLTFTDECSAMAEVGRYWSNGGGGFSSNCDPQYGTARAGSYLPNAWGLYDMHGNVYEWCLDRYGSYPTEAVTDPKGPTTGTGRMKRGGYWRFKAEGCRSAFRNGARPSSSDNSYGFRVACWPLVP